mgnify:FL=1
MKKEIEFEPALRQVISQTFIDTPAPRKTRYRIIRPDLNTLKNAEDNLSIISFLLGAENETRTRDPNLGKVVLYQLSYFRKLQIISYLQALK